MLKRVQPMMKALCRVYENCSEFNCHIMCKDNQSVKCHSQLALALAPNLNKYLTSKLDYQVQIVQWMIEFMYTSKISVTNVADQLQQLAQLQELATELQFDELSKYCISY